MELNIEKIIENIIHHVNDMEDKSGDEFLELIITDIKIINSEKKVIDQMSGLDYGLSRSRHWDKKEKLIFHDGITEDNLINCLEDLEFPDNETGDLILKLSCDGMTDLEEPLNFEFEIKIYDR